jgi:hypothetical protein
MHGQKAINSKDIKENKTRKTPGTPATPPPQEKTNKEENHFLQKTKWKEIPGNRYDLTNAGPPPKFDFHFNRERAGFEFDWA